MREEALRVVAADDEALHHHTLTPGLVQLGFAFFALRELQLAALLEAARGDEPEVYSDSRNSVAASSVSPTLLAQASSLNTLAAPGAVGNVGLLVLGDGGFVGLRGGLGYPDGLDLLGDGVDSAVLTLELVVGFVVGNFGPS